MLLRSKLLDNQTLNEARRAARAQMVATLEAVGNKGPDAQRDLERLMDVGTPHRAVLRELILEADDALNPHRGGVDRALQRAPRLATWARDPLA